MLKLILKLSIFFIFLIFIDLTSLAQEDLSNICSTLEKIDSYCKNLTPASCQKFLERCQSFYEQQAEKYRKEVLEREAKEKTFKNQIAIYNSRIKSLESLIYKTDLEIKALSFQLEDTKKSIQNTLAKIDKTKEALANLLQLFYEQSKRSLVEILLSQETFSQFFFNLTSLEILQLQMQNTLSQLEDLKSYLTFQQEELGREKEELEKSFLLSKLRKEELEKLKKEREVLLAKTRGEKRLFERYLSEAEKKAEEIRAKIFELAQVPEEKAPTLQEAYTLAKQISKITGVRPALLLGLLSVESAIGKNVGQCNCKGNPNCRYPEISWKRVMRKNQWSDFLKITKELGLNPDSTPVSCAINGGRVQWGGAMGPAQFLPSTWMLYKERIEKILKVKPANPWRIKDAFLAAALYLADWGANSQLIKDEIGAVTAYLCGTSRMTPRCQRAGGRAYRYQVMKKTAEYQDYIDKGILK